jgi:hypothetical protein
MGDESFAIVRELFALATERVGGAPALGHHLGLPYSELSPYLTGGAIPPAEVLLRTVDLVVEDLDALKSAFSEHAWLSLARLTR